MNFLAFQKYQAPASESHGGDDDEKSIWSALDDDTKAALDLPLQEQKDEVYVKIRDKLKTMTKRDGAVLMLEEAIENYVVQQLRAGQSNYSYEFVPMKHGLVLFERYLILIIRDKKGLHVILGGEEEEKLRTMAVRGEFPSEMPRRGGPSVKGNVALDTPQELYIIYDKGGKVEDRTKKVLNILLKQTELLKALIDNDSKLLPSKVLELVSSLAVDSAEVAGFDGPVKAASGLIMGVVQLGELIKEKVSYKQDVVPLTPNGNTFTAGIPEHMHVSGTLTLTKVS